MTSEKPRGSSGRGTLAWVGLAWALLSPMGAAAASAYIGEKACIECHGQENRHFTETLHSKVFRQNPKTEAERQVCEACHGPGADHAKDTKNKDLIIGFTKGWATPVEKQNEQCLSCHQGGNRLHWPGSAHASNKMACSDCSANGLLQGTTINDTCQNCHQQQRAEFRKRSHMPVPEGKMSCVDCHNPHGSSTKPLLKAESTNVLCYSCHAEKRGPFLWEHAPVRENCLNCHNAHGSNHDKLLVGARPYLCAQCHNPPVGHPGQFFRADQTAASSAALAPALAAQVPALAPPQSARVIGRSCQNCHSQVHGSNHPSGARFQR